MAVFQWVRAFHRSPASGTEERVCLGNRRPPGEAPGSGSHPKRPPRREPGSRRPHTGYRVAKQAGGRRPSHTGLRGSENRGRKRETGAWNGGDGWSRSSEGACDRACDQSDAYAERRERRLRGGRNRSDIAEVDHARTEGATAEWLARASWGADPGTDREIPSPPRCAGRGRGDYRGEGDGEL